MHKVITELDVYKSSQNVLLFSNMFGSKLPHNFNGLSFNYIEGNATEEYDDDSRYESRYSVWQVGNLFIKIEGTVSSYGDRTISGWKFVQLKEKLVHVYE